MKMAIPALWLLLSCLTGWVLRGFLESEGGAGHQESAAAGSSKAALESGAPPSAARPLTAEEENRLPSSDDLALTRPSRERLRDWLLAAESDPARFAAHLRKILPDLKPVIARDALWALAKYDLSAAIKIASGTRFGGAGRKMLTEAVMSGLGTGSLSEIREVATTLSGSPGDPAYAQTVSRLAESDPAWASDLLRHPDKSVKALWDTRLLVRGLAAQDPALALEFAVNQPEATRTHRLTDGVSHVMEVVADQDPAKALAMLKASPLPPQLLTYGVQGILQALPGCEAPAPVLREMRDLVLSDLNPDTAGPGTVQEVQGHLLELLAARDPAAARVMMAQIPPAGRQADFTETVVLGEHQGDYAAALADLNQDPDTNRKSISLLCGRWAWEQPQEAEASLADQQVKPETPTILKGLAGQYENLGPDALRRWFGGLPAAYQALLPEYARDFEQKAAEGAKEGDFGKGAGG